MKIAICSHAHSTVDFNVHANHLAVFSKWAKLYDTVFIGISGMKNAQARNVIMGQVIEQECDYAIFIDVDHMIDESLLPYLMQHMIDENVAMASGLICKRGYPFEQVGFIMDEDKLYRKIDFPVGEKCFKVDVCAFGCTVISIAWMKKLSEPYFRDQIDIRIDNNLEYNKRSDIVICERFKSLGADLIIDTRAEVGHVIDKPAVIYPSNRKAIQECWMIEHTAGLERTEFQVPVYKAAAELIEANNDLKDDNIKRVVDLGCGRGLKLASYIKPLGKEIVGVDRVENDLQVASSLMPDGDFILGDLEDGELPFNLNETDLVIMSDVLEHLLDPLEFLKKIPETVTCIFSTPDASTVDTDIKENTEHKHAWTEDEFKAFLIKAGFIALSIATYKERLGYMGIIAIARKLGDK